MSYRMLNNVKKEERLRNNERTLHQISSDDSDESVKPVIEYVLSDIDEIYIYKIIDQLGIMCYNVNNESLTMSKDDKDKFIQVYTNKLNDLLRYLKEKIEKFKNFKYAKIKEGTWKTDNPNTPKNEMRSNQTPRTHHSVRTSYSNSEFYDFSDRYIIDFVKIIEEIESFFENMKLFNTDDTSNKLSFIFNKQSKLDSLVKLAKSFKETPAPPEEPALPAPPAPRTRLASRTLQAPPEEPALLAPPAPRTLRTPLASRKLQAPTEEPALPAPRTLPALITLPASPAPPLRSKRESIGGKKSYRNRKLTTKHKYKIIRSYKNANRVFNNSRRRRSWRNR